jgi:YidC/Oxa1 family membrane protein insertase
MDKRTLLFIAISAAILLGYWGIQYRFFPPVPAGAPAGQSAPADAPAANQPPAASGVTPAVTPVTAADETAAAGDRPPDTDTAVPVETAAGPETAGKSGGAGAIAEETVVIETGLLRVSLSNRGGDIVSFRLKQHKDKNEAVEMVLSPPGKEAHAFTIAFGGMDARPLASLL